MEHPSVPPYLKEDRFAELVGIELILDKKGKPAARLEIAEHHLNGLKTAQGGCIFTLADYAFALASNSDGRVSVALNLSINFINAAHLGDILTAKVRELSRRRVISIYEITIVNQDQEAVAQLTATAYKVGER